MGLTMDAEGVSMSDEMEKENPVDDIDSVDEFVGDNDAELDYLYAEFNRKFPISKLETLSLDEYTNLKENSTDSFCYWLEFKLDSLGGYSYILYTIRHL